MCNWWKCKLFYLVNLSLSAFERTVITVNTSLKMFSKLVNCQYNSLKKLIQEHLMNHLQVYKGSMWSLKYRMELLKNNYTHFLLQLKLQFRDKSRYI